MASRRPRAHARHATHAPNRHVLSAVGSAAAAVLGFSAVFGTAYLGLAQSSINREDISSLIGATDSEGKVVETTEPTDFAAGEDLNILLIGSDERNDENATIGGDVADGMRSDTTMIMHISADRSRIDVISIPRDMRVDVADCQMFDGTTKTGWTAKFNTAFSLGGSNGNRAEAAACTMRTVTDETGIEFNGHYVVVDFTGFIDMVDALGGVPMCITHDMYSKKAKLDLEAGPQVLDGETALAFARARTGTGLGDGTDLMRIERQQELLTNTARKALGLNLLTDIGELTQFIKAGAESITMDSQLGSITNLAGLAYSLRNFDTDNLTFTTVPWEYSSDDTGDVLAIEDEAQALFQAIIDDEPMPGEDEETTTSPTPDASASATPSTSETPTTDPSISATTPERETEADILAQCEALEY
ncbi:LCP family protein [Demequina sp.]|uniref:LCP family protein n=1 Tax=Demequina sp. TaxID=2050685 RepID=UPI003A876408